MTDPIFPRLGKLDRRQLQGLEARRAEHPRRIRLPAGGMHAALARRAPANRWLQLGLPLLGALFIAAFAADLFLAGRGRAPGILLTDVPTEIQRLRAGRHGPVYTAPNRLFRVVAPPGWMVYSGADAAPYETVFRSPNGVSVSIMTTPVPYNDLPSLYDDIERREEEGGIRTAVEVITFHHQPAVQRVAKLTSTKVISIDFVADRVAHHILCAIPQEFFEQYRPALLEWLQTYEPLPPPPPRRAGRP